MAGELPPELAALLVASDPDQAERAWTAFVAAYTRLLLHSARSLGRDYDAAMDRYAYVLERLRERDFHRLRSYVPDGRTRFTTWLVVIARRLAVDHYRQRYGRAPAGSDPSALAGRSLRRQLADELHEPASSADLASATQALPDAELGASDRSRSLEAAVAALAPDDRLLLKLRFEDGLSAREIAPIVHLPTLFHVYRRLNAVLAALRRDLRARGIEAGD